MGNRSISTGFSIFKPWGFLGILVLIFVAGGCIDRESRAGLEIPAGNISRDNLTPEQYDSGIRDVKANISMAAPAKTSKPNQVFLIYKPKELNKTGKLPIMLKIMNPTLNETVLTVFKPEFGMEWYNQTNITYIANRNWTQNFSIKPAKSIRFIRMFVQISENNTVVKRAAWNMTFEAPVERTK